jgi:hypothetical protein
MPKAASALQAPSRVAALPQTSAANTSRAPAGETTIANVPSPRIYQPLPNAPQPIAWHELAGSSPLDQLKTVLAGIGLLALLMQLLGRLGRAA